MRVEVEGERSKERGERVSRERGDRVRGTVMNQPLITTLTTTR